MYFFFLISFLPLYPTSGFLPSPACRLVRLRARASAVTPPLLEVSGLVATVGGCTILNGVDLCVRRGELHAIMVKWPFFSTPPRIFIFHCSTGAERVRKEHLVQSHSRPPGLQGNGRRGGVRRRRDFPAANRTSARGGASSSPSRCPQSNSP